MKNRIPLFVLALCLPTSYCFAAQTKHSVGFTSVAISSTPVGAEIYLDDDFVGNTPSTINTPAGKHSISLKKRGFEDWVREVSFSGGTITLTADLVSSSAVPAPPITAGMNETGYVSCVAAKVIKILSRPRQLPIVAFVECGEKIYILEEELEQFRKIRTLDGKVGYIDSSFISMRPSVNEQRVAQNGAITAHAGIEGAVFLITQAGDVKPVRLAKVGLFPSTSESENMIDSFNILAKGLADMRDKVESDGFPEQRELVEIKCLKAILVLAGKLKPETFQNQTDEFGKFSFEGIPAGEYTTIVLGHGGMNASLWISNVSIEVGKTNSIKMSQPIISCFDPKHIASF
jgi:hypothetical protein